MGIQRFAEAESEVSGRRRRHGLRGDFGRLRVGYGAPILDFGQESSGFVVLRLNVQDHPEDSHGAGDVSLRGTQPGVRQGRERSSRVHLHYASPGKMKRPLRALREGAEDSKFSPP